MTLLLFYFIFHGAIVYISPKHVVLVSQGSEFSVEKVKTVFFTRRKVGEEVCMMLFGNGLENEQTFRFLESKWLSRARR